MHTNQLRYFVSVASLRSFTLAAEQHYLTQTAITLQIKALEEQVGAQLINRQKRPIELTPAGRVFFREAKSILARLDSAVAKAKEADTGAVGSIRIGYEKGYERSDLSDRLRAFHRAYPNILFTCIRADSDKLAGMLLADELDVIFAWDSTDLASNKDIFIRTDLRSPLSCVLYSGHPLSGRTVLKREDLREETILYMSPSAQGNSLGDTHYLKLYEQAGYQPRILLTSNDIESLMMMVAAEEGITILPEYSVAKLNNAENLVFLPMEGEEEYEEVDCMCKKQTDNGALQCFLSFLEQLDS